MNYQKYDLIITTNYIKKELLKDFSKNNIISKCKIITKSELDEILLGSVKKESINFLVETFNLTYEKSKVILKNIFFKSDKIKEYHDALLQNNLITKSNSYLINSKNILLINVLVDKFYSKYFNGEIEYFSYENIYTHNVFEYKTAEEEVVASAFKILKLLENININDIKLVNVNDDYKLLIKKMFSVFNIPVFLNEKRSIYKTNTCNDFINTLRQTRCINDSLNLISKDEVYDKLVSYFNSYTYNEINNLTLKIIIDDIKSISLNEERFKNSLECINLDDILNDNKYYFIFGFNEGSIPIYYKDEDFISDEEKSRLGLYTSIEKNINYKSIFKNIFFNTKNINISYKLKSNFYLYTPSYYISEFNLKVVNDFENNYNISNLYNKIMLGRYLDNLVKYGEYHNDLDLLYSNYKISSYSNNFTGISYTPSKEINLSYSSINDFYECSFKYYVERVLRLNKTEETLALIIGKVFHDVLSKIYASDFDFDKSYSDAIGIYDLSSKNKVFLDILKNELKIIIEYILSFERVTTLKNNFLEEDVMLSDIIPDKVNLKGIIDKFKTDEDNTLGIVIDYKTGTISTDMSNINHGLNLQLPIYIYLAKKRFPDITIGGFYLQKILKENELDKTLDDKIKHMRLDGYSISDENLLASIDSTYTNSEFIKSLKMTKNGFYAYSKVLSSDQIDKVMSITEDKIKNSANEILSGNFIINPKSINNKNLSCKYCNFKDICFMKEEDVIILEDTKLKELL